MKNITSILRGIMIILLVLLNLSNALAMTPSEKQKPKTGDFISLDLSYSIKMNGKDTVLFDSKNQKDGLPVKFKLPPPDFKNDLYEQVLTLSEGDTATFLVNADSLFLKTFRMTQLPAGVEPNSNLTFRVKLIKVETTESLKEGEQATLQKYIKDNNITVSPSPKGVYVVEQTKGDGPKVDSGFMVKLHFNVSLLDGTPLFNSYDRPEPLKFEYGKKFDTQGFDEGIGKLSKGSKALIIVPSSMGFAEKGQGNLVPPYASLVYNVEIIDVISKAEYDKEMASTKDKQEQMKLAAKNEEASKLQKYLTDNKIEVKPNPSGLIYIENTKGTGPKAEAGKMVKVHYTGKLLDGTKFDSSVDRNEPFEFLLGQGQVIQGWDEGIALMNVGGKATLIIPSSIAYGDRDMGVIPPYATLVFDVELLEVK